MRVLDQIQDFDVVKLDVEVLIDRLQDPADANVILELDGDSLVGEGFEEAIQIMGSASAAKLHLRGGMGRT